MYNETYFPSLSEDPYFYPTAYSESLPEGGESPDWIYSQELEPIIPFTDDTQGTSGVDEGFSMPDSMNQPMPDRPAPPVRPDRPAPPIRPDRPTPPVRPDRPIPPFRPDRPTPPFRPDRPTPPFRPDRPTPPFRPDRPTPPVTSDWSWNWGVLLPGNAFPTTTARVRFYNAAVREPVQIYVNNRLVVSNLNFMNFTRFYNVAPGRYRITVYRGSNLMTPIADSWMTFSANTSSTITVTGTGSDFWLQSTTF